LLLTPYKETDAHGPSFTQPAAELIEGEEEYEVEAIIGHKRRGKGKQYLIKWLGYPTLENSWEWESNLEHAAGLLKEYKRRNKF